MPWNCCSGLIQQSLFMRLIVLLSHNRSPSLVENRVIRIIMYIKYHTISLFWVKQSLGLEWLFPTDKVELWERKLSTNPVAGYLSYFFRLLRQISSQSAPVRWTPDPPQRKPEWEYEDKNRNRHVRWKKKGLKETEPLYSQTFSCHWSRMALLLSEGFSKPL